MILELESFPLVADLPLIRYFCSVTGAKDPDRDTWGDVGFDYFEAIAEIFPRVRVFADGLLHQVMLAKNSRWHKHSRVFGEPVSLPYINVVCGPEAVLQRYYTAKVPNVAITSTNGVLGDRLTQHVQRQWENATKHGRDPWGRTYEAAPEDTGLIHERFDLVACLTPSDTVALSESGVIARHLQPAELAEAVLDLADLTTPKGPSDADPD